MLQIQHKDANIAEDVAYEFKFELHSLGHKVLRHFRVPTNQVTFRFVFGNKECLEKVYLDKKVEDLMKKLDFLPFEQSSNRNSNMNLWTVHVS